MLKSPEKTFPAAEVLLVNPVTGKVMNFQPLMALLFEQYGDDKLELVDAVYQVRDYLMRDDATAGDAAELRKSYNTLNRLALALDAVTVKTLAE